MHLESTSSQSCSSILAGIRVLGKQGVWRQAGLVILLALAVTSCRQGSDKMVPLMPNGVADMVIIYKKDATDEQISHFLNNVLAHPRADGRGYESLPAIQLVGKLNKIQGHEATAIVYHSYATLNQREEVKRAASGSQIVYKILEQVKPSEIKKIM
jgi:hypothetical protein